MITNRSNIPLALAVWLLQDNYDYQDQPNYVSATALMKPLRHIVLGPRVDRKTIPLDVEELIPRALGHSMHDSVEKAWTHGHARALKQLGYPDSLIERVRINPTDAEMRASNSIIAIYLEQRAFRTITVNGVTYTVGGKFDLVAEGIVQDTKTTSAFTWLHGGKDDDYRLQMSLYRWIDAAQPLRKITEDYGQINFVFTDWQKAQARGNPAYPQKRIETKQIPLLSLKETERWVEAKLAQVQRHADTPEELLPHCTDEELWRSDPVFKYYADATKTSGRSTRNFSSLAEAKAFQAEKGGRGTVITVPGEPKRCLYCDVASICSQIRQLFPNV